ncbi:MAG: zinc ribbon domain-containing protein [Gammaproteobacteria bacterium]|nr:zinc ribbon domain-containing protein [Gammaproteobacteria bacterium]
MPIYEYQCESCAHQFETMQKLSEAVLTDCPECGESALKKLVSRVSFRLKGSGWYETDFKSDNKRNVADSAKSEESAHAERETSTHAERETSTRAERETSSGDSASDGSTKDSSKSEASSKDDSAASSSEKGERKSEAGKKKGNDDKAA